MDMAWEVEVSDEFKGWYEALSRDEQKSVALGVKLLEDFGPSLGRPHVDAIQGSAFPNMKELRVQHRGKPYRILFAFDPRRNAYLIVGGDKTGQDDWYDSAIQKADTIYKQHLIEIGE
jgi:hypothetical protein